ncbi:MAG: outer membrane lipoprotein carrier protein LolA [Cyclobacteriaceae bacterium]|nr:outer membrane lipoprotein carrier protein LolA [Cyclobacteriaceae bacterium]
MKYLIISTFLVFVAGKTFSQYDPKALETLEAMSAKLKAMGAFEADFTYRLTNDVDNINEEFKGKMTVKGDKYRLTLPEQEVINNGTTLWTYLPDANEVNIDNYDPDSEDVNPSKIFEIYKKDFKYLYLKDETVGGVLCEVIDLVPEKPDAQFFKIRMNIAKKDKSVKSFTMFDKGGNRYTYSITEFNPNINVDDSFFAFDPKKHPGVDIIDLR